jgi:acetylornithine aminotransferase
MTEPIRGLIETYRRHPIEFVSGKGAILTDTDGKEYIDMLGGIAVASVGHANPKVADAISDQAHRLVMVSNYFRTGPMTALAGRLHDLTGMNSFFGNSGAEAVECALKLARRWALKNKKVANPKIIAADHSFHGRTFGALSATGQPAKRDVFAPLLPGFVYVPFGDAAALEAAFDTDVIAVLLEPIQGEGGVVIPPDDYLAAARKLCDERGALLILDEIQTAFGRTGKMFAHEHYGVKPDIMTVAKALGGGMPIGACLAKPEVSSSFELGDHGTTFGGGPVPCAAALAVLDIIEEEGLVERSAMLGERLKEGAKRAFPGAIDIRGKGLMVAAEFDRELSADIVAAALTKGVIANNCTPNVVRMVPPLVITEEQIDRAIDVLEEVWSSFSS